MSAFGEGYEYISMLENHVKHHSDEEKRLRGVIQEAIESLPKVRTVGYRPGDWLDVPRPIFFKLVELRARLEDALTDGELHDYLRAKALRSDTPAESLEFAEKLIAANAKPIYLREAGDAER